MSLNAGETIVLVADLDDVDDPRYPRTPQPTSVVVRVLSEDEATYHLGTAEAGVAMVLISKDTGTASSGATSSLTDASKLWNEDPQSGAAVENRWKGHLVKITTGTGSGAEKRIASNTGTVLTIVGKWGTPPDGTSVYAIHRARYEYEWACPVTLENKRVWMVVEETLSGGKVNVHRVPLVIGGRKR
jgi:hypothetical protein